MIVGFHLLSIVKLLFGAAFCFPLLLTSAIFGIMRFVSLLPTSLSVAKYAISEWTYRDLYKNVHILLLVFEKSETKKLYSSSILM